MREIKFKVFNLETKKMMDPWGLVIGVDGGKVNQLGMNDDGVVLYFIGDKTVPLQYTGLKDSEGVEIFEGDIILYRDGDDPDIKVVVDYVWNVCSYRGFRSPQNPKIKESDYFYSLHNMLDGKVIGNIYENPELLES